MRPAAFLLTLAILPAAAAAQEAEPLSAIDWLSQSVESAAAAQTNARPQPQPDANEPPVAEGAGSPEITVRPLDAADPDGIGLLPQSVTGLPPTLWSASSADVLATLVRAESTEMLPALRDVFVSLLVAEADAPLGGGSGDFFLARIDRLLDLGDLEPAQALLEKADRSNPEVFRRWFDVTLLTGTEDDACAFMQDRPALAPTFPARIFCLARGGDWNAAALTLSTARTLGDLTEEEDALLTRFLDPEAFGGEAPLAAPSRPSPLLYRLREAIGEPVSAATLPRAFAHADLRPVAAWRNQIEAAERLARAGAVSPNVLFDLYLRQVPAASGGIWERAAAIQTLDLALTQGPDAVAAALAPAWAAMAAPRAETAFAAYYGERLLAAGLTGDAAALAWRIALLSPRYEEAALSGVPEGAGNAVLAAVARGAVDGVTGSDERETAVLAGFASEPAPAMLALLADGKLGEAILRTLGAMGEGAETDPLAMTEGIALLRHVGLEDAARRTALEYLLLGPAG